MDIVTNAAISAAVGIITALLATYLALRRFRAEKLWEKKIDAYTRLISAAHEMKRTREAEIDARRRGGEVPNEYGNRLWDESREAKRTILQLADAASFLIHDEIELATFHLKESLEKALEGDSWLETLLIEDEALSAYLTSLKQVARRELRA